MGDSSVKGYVIGGICTIIASVITGVCTYCATAGVVPDFLTGSNSTAAVRSSAAPKKDTIIKQDGFQYTTGDRQENGKMIIVEGEKYLPLSLLLKLAGEHAAWDDGSNTLTIAKDPGSSSSMEPPRTQSKKAASSPSDGREFVWGDEVPYYDFSYSDRFNVMPVLNSVGKMRDSECALFLSCHFSRTDDILDYAVEFKYDVSAYSRLSCTLSIDDRYAPAPSDICVMGDGKVLDRLSGLNGLTKRIDRELDLNGVKELTVKMTTPGASEGGRVVCFENPKFYI